MIGAVLSIRCEVGQSLVSWRENSDYREGVSARREMGGGVLLELSHEIDYLAWIFGRINWVSAWIGKQSNLEIDVEDTAHLLLGFETTQIVPPIASLNLDFIRHDVTRRCVAIGEKGSLAWDAVRGTVEVCLQSEGEWSPLHQSSVERDFSYKAQWQSFFGMSRSRKGLKDSPAANLEHAIQVLCVTDAARASSVQQALQVNIPVGAWDAL
jgi:predicted dehydrogenase